MVSWSGSEVQLLLSLVKERESLYDVANEDYTNRDIVWALWTDIARQLNKTLLIRYGMNSVRLQKEGKYNKATACRDKWTSLRCVYRRIVNQQANSKTKRKIKWPWANMMTFLIPHLKTIQPRYGPDVEIDDTDSIITITDHKAYGTHDNRFLTLGNSEDYDIEETAVNSEDGVVEYLYDESGSEYEPLEDQRLNKQSVKRIKSKDTSQLSQLHTRHGRNMKSGSSNSGSTYRTENVDEFIKLIHSPHEEPSTVTVEQCNHMLQKYDQLAGIDPDEMFFRSIVPDVKLLNQRDKGAFKLKVQQMLHDMLYPPKENEQDTAVQSSP